MDSNKKALFDRIANRIRKDADRLANLAAYSGDMGDRGSSALKTSLEIWLAGLRGEIPACWNKYELEDRRETDPEYKDFLRLKQKFAP